MEKVKVTKFNLQDKIALATVAFDVTKNGITKTRFNDIATRCKTQEQFEERLKERNHCDGVAIVGMYVGLDSEVRVPLIKELKPVSGYIWTFPAGQVEKGEDLKQTAIRELKEETGLDVLNEDKVAIQRATFSSVGLTDQRVSLAFLECTGTPSDEYTTQSEDIQTRLFTLNEIRDLLKSKSEIAGSTRLTLGLILLANGDFDKVKEVL